ncbi:TolC family protein [Bacillus salinus]|uniref:TolC family protein n=1 Tax=Bacillus sp. HMF5848 TaxID=2495421 RepID=UPI001639A70C|nr:TolC family protein [Bacillus sp. HMF5848]
MKRTALVLAGAILLVPTGAIIADSIKQYTVPKAAEEIVAKDLSLQITASKPEIHDDSAPYQGEFSDELEVIGDKSNEYSDFSKKLQVELSAYQTLYNYWLADAAFKIEKENVAQAEKELEIMKKKVAQGVESKMQLMSVETSLNNALVRLADAEQQANAAKYMLNQDLGNELTENILLDTKIDDSTFTYVPEKEYKVENYLPNLLENHASLGIIQTSIKQYEEIVKDSQSLSVLGEDNFESQIEGTEAQINMTLAKIAGLEQLKNTVGLSPYEQSVLDELYLDVRMKDAQLKGILEALDDAEDDRDRAERDWKKYYEEELAEANIQLQQAQQGLQFLAYNYEDRFEAMKKKIGLQYDNLARMKQLYTNNQKMYELGMITQSELESFRLNLVGVRLQLNMAKKDYFLLTKEFELFKQGYMPGAGGGGF